MVGLGQHGGSAVGVSHRIEVPTLADVLLRPPGSQRYTVRDLVQTNNSSTSHTVKRAPIRLFCPHEDCGRESIFDPEGGDLWTGQVSNLFVVYVCRHCERVRRTYAIWVYRQELAKPSGLVIKFGETPPFGPPLPSRLISLLGPDNELFQKGRQSENQGLGIAAFAYYRRVVENQKDRILDELGRVAVRLGIDLKVVERIQQAKSEQQFTTAIEKVKDLLPPQLLIDGHHNPLNALHKALSRGLHEQDDADCLELAESVREVLSDLAERMGEALKERAHLKKALGRLMREEPSGGTESHTSDD